MKRLLPRVDLSGGFGVEEVECLPEFFDFIFGESRSFDFLFAETFGGTLSSHLNLTVIITLFASRYINII